MRTLFCACRGAQVTVQGTTISTQRQRVEGIRYVKATGTMLTCDRSQRHDDRHDQTPATGVHAQGLYNGDGGRRFADARPAAATAIVTDSTILTKGVDLDRRRHARTAARPRVNGGSYTTSGNGSVAVFAAYDGSVTVARRRLRHRNADDLDLGTSAAAVVADSGS